MRMGLIAMVLSLTLVIQHTVPASAQEEQTVAITYELVLYGDAPVGATFDVLGGKQWSDDLIASGVFCGSGVTGRKEADAPPCVGGGEAYRIGPMRYFRPGNRVSYVIRWRSEVHAFEEIRRETTARLYADTTVRTSYTFLRAPSQPMPFLPSTGAGGIEFSR